MKSLYFLLYLSVFLVLIYTKSINIDNGYNKNITLIERSHTTCDPEAFGSINRNYAVSFYNLPKGEIFNIYDCRIEYDNTLIACRTDRPLMPDDFVAFRVKRSTAYKCKPEICGQPSATRQNFIFDKNGNIRGTTREKKVNIGDHFCYRYVYNGQKCDVNYEILAMKYQYNTELFISFAKFIKNMKKFAKGI